MVLVNSDMQSLILKVENGLPAIFVVLQSHMTDNLIHQDLMVLPLVLRFLDFRMV